MLSKSDSPELALEANEPTSLDDMAIGGSGTYNLAKINDSIKDVTNKPKRPFLRRGQGKNCLNNLKPVKKKTQKRPSSAPAARTSVTGLKNHLNFM